jgi:hypothetical protein
MTRQAQTETIYILQGNYGYGHGWEDLTAEAMRKEARQQLRTYYDNAPEGVYRTIARRVWIDTQEPYRGPRPEPTSHDR